LALRKMGSVTVRNYMPTDPIVDAVGCLSRGGNCRHGAPPFELQGRPRDKPITANARTKTANARPLNPFASNKRMAARASHTSCGGRDALARVAARVAYRGHCQCLRDGDAQVEPCRVRTPGRSTPGLGHPQPFPLDEGDERRDAGKLGRRVNRGRDLRNGAAKQPGAILCRHSNVLDCPAETVPQAVEI